MTVSCRQLCRADQRCHTADRTYVVMAIIPVKKGVDKTEIFAYNIKVNLKTLHLRHSGKF